MVTETNSFENYLQERYEEKKEKNPSYSIRAFAFQLGVEPSLMSKYFRGERKVTYKMFNRITEGLGIEKDEILLLSEKYFARKPDEAEHFFKIKQNEITVMDSIVYYILLELRELSDYEPTIDWACRKLGMHKEHLVILINKLKVNGLAEFEGQKFNLLKPRSNSTISHRGTTTALKSIQSGAIELAKRALDNTHINYRHNTTLTFAIPSANINKYKRAMNNFILKCSKMSEEHEDKKDAVYNMMMSFYPVSQISGEGR